MPDRVLITGGAGFIGSHIADRYLAHGMDVTILDDLSSGSRDNIPDGVEFVEAGVNDPVARELLADGGFTLLNHHAAQLDVRVSVRDPGLDARINLLGLVNLLEGAREGGVKRVVFASSGGVVYGESMDLPHGETAPKLPVSPYGVSKLSSEYYLGCFRTLYGIEAACLRYSNVYGPRQSPHGEAGVVSIFGSRIKAGKPLTVFGDGQQTRDYVFVGDVAEANLLAGTRDLPAFDAIDDPAFNVGTGIETTVVDLARTMITASGNDVNIEHQDARAGELLRSCLSADKINQLWGWSPRTSLADGLAETYQWILETS